MNSIAFVEEEFLFITGYLHNIHGYDSYTTEPILHIIKSFYGFIGLTIKQVPHESNLRSDKDNKYEYKVYDFFNVSYGPTIIKYSNCVTRNHYRSWRDNGTMSTSSITIRTFKFYHYRYRGPRDYCYRKSIRNNDEELYYYVNSGGDSDAEDDAEREKFTIQEIEEQLANIYHVPTELFMQEMRNNVGSLDIYH